MKSIVFTQLSRECVCGICGKVIKKHQNHVAFVEMKIKNRMRVHTECWKKSRR
jgi:hypothetical protein